MRCVPEILPRSPCPLAVDRGTIVRNGSVRVDYSLYVALDLFNCLSAVLWHAGKGRMS